MADSTTSKRSIAYQPALAWFATIGGAWVFVLITLGAFTTTIGAGMVFQDWPLSNGSLNPHGWLEHVAMFAEHSHRLSGILMGLITIILAVWLSRRDARRWMRQLGWFAVALVIIQGLIGGTRVLFDAVHVPGFEMTLGQMLRIPHGIVAQVYICVLILIAVSLSKGWFQRSIPVSPSLRRTGAICIGLLLLQLAVAATMRHNHAGLAIPTFPASTADGHLLPAVWGYQVELNFAHRVMALILTVALIWYAIKLWIDRGATLLMKSGASIMVGLLALQILLGAHVVWQMREAHVTTGHVVCGALLLATTFWLTCLAHRDVIAAKTSIHDRN